MQGNTQISDAMVEAAAEAMKQRRRETIEGHREPATFEEQASLALSASLAGHVVVPREPTQDMIDAATTATSGCGCADHDYDDDIRDQYRAMISAAPAQREG